MILSAQSIRRRCLQGMIRPFHERSVFGGMTYGLSIAGYDIRIAEDMVIPDTAQFALGSSIEHFEMPLDLLAKVCDKSTWARRGLFVQNTIIEPGWCGHLTLELTNQGFQWVQLKRGTPIAQIIFQLLDEPAEAGYKGKYTNQPNYPVPALFEDDVG
jgi:dCTP deaminase